MRHITKREALIAQAAELFRERDFTSVTLREIGQTAGLSAQASADTSSPKSRLSSASPGGPPRRSLRRSPQHRARHRLPRKPRLRSHAAMWSRLSPFAISLRSTRPNSSSYLPTIGRSEFAHAHVRCRTRPCRAGRTGIGAEEALLRAGSMYSLVNEVVIYPSL